MQLTESRHALVDVVQYLRQAGIEPIVYGSVGVSFYLGAYKQSFDDLDLLIEDAYITEDWPALQKIMQAHEFVLTDEHEHEFSNGHTRVAFAGQSILVRDGITDPGRDRIFVPFEDTDFQTLTPAAFERAYAYSAKDGYRMQQRHKKDNEVLALLQAYIAVTTMHLTEPPFTQIERGEKTVELRLYDAKRSQIKVGDIVTFTLRPANERTVAVLVTAVYRAATFSALAEKLDVLQTGFASKEQLVESMVTHYPLEEQADSGVVGIEFTVLRGSSLVVLMGLPGSGKTFLAKQYAQRGFTVVSGEVVADELFGSASGLSADQYAAVYEQVRGRAKTLLDGGHRVVIDGTNLVRAYRQQIYDVCAGYPISLIFLEVDRATAMERIAARQERGEGSGCDEQTFMHFETQLEVPDETEPVFEGVI